MEKIVVWRKQLYGENSCMEKIGYKEVNERKGWN